MYIVCFVRYKHNVYRLDRFPNQFTRKKASQTPIRRGCPAASVSVLRGARYEVAMVPVSITVALFWSMGFGDDIQSHERRERALGGAAGGGPPNDIERIESFVFITLTHYCKHVRVLNSVPYHDFNISIFMFLHNVYGKEKILS